LIEKLSKLEIEKSSEMSFYEKMSVNGTEHFRHLCKKMTTLSCHSLFHRFERMTRYNLGLAIVGNSLETVGSYVNKI
jgi:hypothetical protein